jgi:signal transduction histidine kinase
VSVESHVRAGIVHLIIEDNGRGLRDGYGTHRPSLGMTGMRACAQEIQGELRLAVPEQDRGLRIEVEVPLEWAVIKDAEQEDTNIIGG